MAGFDGTGPNGQGPMTGRGMGNCVVANNSNSFRKGSFGRGCGRGFRNRCFSNLGVSVNTQSNDIDSLTLRAQSLKNELDNINKIIESLKHK